MKKQVVLLAAVALILIMGTAMLARASANGADTAAWYVVDGGTAAGGGYHLTGMVWRFRGEAKGERYRLLEPAASGTGCCCTYLPCLLRNY